MIFCIQKTYFRTFHQPGPVPKPVIRSVRFLTGLEASGDEGSNSNISMQLSPKPLGLPLRTRTSSKPEKTGALNYALTEAGFCSKGPMTDRASR